MTVPADLEMGDLTRLVLHHVPGTARPGFATALAFDEAIAATHARASEPILGQMRMAWWRDRLRELPLATQAADPLLNAISNHLAEQSQALELLLDGWEALLIGEDQGAGRCDAFIEGKRSLFAALARIAGYPGRSAECEAHGETFALAEQALVREGEVMSEQQGDAPRLPRLPRELRGIAIIGGLSRRVLRRGRGPIFGDRGSALAALRIGLVGR